MTMTTSTPSTLTVGPSLLSLSVTTLNPLSPLTLEVLSLYANAVASKVMNNEMDASFDALKVEYAGFREFSAHVHVG